MRSCLSISVAMSMLNVRCTQVCAAACIPWTGLSHSTWNPYLQKVSCDFEPVFLVDHRLPSIYLSRCWSYMSGVQNPLLVDDNRSLYDPISWGLFVIIIHHGNSYQPLYWNHSRWWRNAVLDQRLELVRDHLFNIVGVEAPCWCTRTGATVR